jgi:hypothetical protein
LWSQLVDRAGWFYESTSVVPVIGELVGIGGGGMGLLANGAKGQSTTVPYRYCNALGYITVLYSRVEHDSG